MEIIDLTHELHEDIPSWTGRCGFHKEIIMDYDKGVRVMKYKCHAGIGTHMDAPSHFIPGGRSISDITLKECSAPLVVIEKGYNGNPSITIDSNDVIEFEKKNGRIKEGSFVAAYTHWSTRWSDVKKYRNENRDGIMDFPSFSEECATLLIQRGVVGIGIDTMSPDSPTQITYPVHKAILGANKYIIENLTNLHKLPAIGATIYLYPIKVKDGAEAPIRALALLH